MLWGGLGVRRTSGMLPVLDRPGKEIGSRSIRSRWPESELAELERPFRIRHEVSHGQGGLGAGL